MGKQWKQCQTLFLGGGGGGSKITADGDYSHEIKRCLLLGRKAMINLDSILNSRDITLPTKVHLVKAMVFPVVMHGCEKGTIKKAEHWRIHAFELWCWRRLLGVPWTARKSNQSVQFSSVQLLSCVQLFATTWTTAHQASLSITNSQSLPKLMSIKSVMPSNHLIVCHPLLLLPSIFPSIRVFSSELALRIRGAQSIRASASASVLPINIQGWFPLGLTGLISFCSRGLSRVFASTIIQKHQFFGAQPSLWSNSHIRTQLLEKP